MSKAFRKFLGLYADEEEERKEKDFKAELQDLGISVIQDERLEQRLRKIDALNAFIDEPFPEDDVFVEQIKWCQDKLDAFNMMIRQVAEPFGRGADAKWFNSMIGHWKNLYYYSLEVIKSVKTLLKTPRGTVAFESEEKNEEKNNVDELDRSRGLGAFFDEEMNRGIYRKSDDEFEKIRGAAIIEQLVGYLNEVFPRAEKIIAVSYSKWDVIPVPPVVLHQPKMEGEEKRGMKGREGAPIR